MAFFSDQLLSSEGSSEGSSERRREQGVREMCEAQKDIFVEGSCSAQLCETGDC
jgi:hypothetical protein